MDERMSSPDSPFMYSTRRLHSEEETSVSTPKQVCRRMLTTRLLNESTPLSSESDKLTNSENISIEVPKHHYCPGISSPMMVSPLGMRSKNIPEEVHHNRIMDVVDKSNQDRQLIGDFSKSHALPLIPGKHHDLKCISPATLAGLINGDFKDMLPDFIVIDCRYPYEYEGGHIIGAENIYTSDALIQRFFNENHGHSEEVKRTAVIFHCEFSSKRAPKMCRLMRKHDRDQNCYPNLHYPELYILDGGYKAFFEGHEDLCHPRTYFTMDSNATELRKYQSIRSKSFGDSKRAPAQSRSLKRTTLRNFDC